MQYPLLLISNIHTVDMQNLIEKEMPNPDYCEYKALLVVDRGDTVIEWKEVGLTNRFLRTLSSYGIEYTYYVEKGKQGKLPREKLIDMNAIHKGIVDLDKPPIEEDFDYKISPEILETSKFIEGVMSKCL